MENKKITILVVDDEDRIRRLLKMYLERENFIIDEASDGEEALEKALEKDYDLILLDLMMPKMDGLEVAKQLREKKTTPIMMLTAKGEEANRIQGFEAGTDDYIVKPFSPREVVLRVTAILKRTHVEKEEENENTDLIVTEHIEIDNLSHSVLVDNEPVNLTPKEYELLLYLTRSPNQIFGREQLLREVWKYEFFGDLRTVDRHVKRLREKLAKQSQEAARAIVTVWGLGYKFNTTIEESKK